MIDEAHLERVPISVRPRGQLICAPLLSVSYRIPHKTTVLIEGLERIPEDRGVILALNHTDRYNYWPFQWKLYQLGHPRFTTTWVKAKYYEHPALAWFFDRCNNIPLPSKGYVILKDAVAALGRKLEDTEYRVLRDLCDGRVSHEDAQGLATESLRTVFTKPRPGFDPGGMSYEAFIESKTDRLMGLVEARTVEALGEKRNHLIVFPQGTRSIRLLPCRTGLLQFALRHGTTVIPVGSNGCEHVYPGGSPWASGGDIVYRVGEPVDLGDCAIDEPYRPFTKDADAHKDALAKAADRLTGAIDALLDEPYRRRIDEEDDRSRADRLM